MISRIKGHIASFSQRQGAGSIQTPSLSKEVRFTIDNILDTKLKKQLLGTKYKWRSKRRPRIKVSFLLDGDWDCAKRIFASKNLPFSKAKQSDTERDYTRAKKLFYRAVIERDRAFVAACKYLDIVLKHFVESPDSFQTELERILDADTLTGPEKEKLLEKYLDCLPAGKEDALVLAESSIEQGEASDAIVEPGGDEKATEVSSIDGDDLELYDEFDGDENERRFWGVIKRLPNKDRPGVLEVVAEVTRDFVTGDFITESVEFLKDLGPVAQVSLPADSRIPDGIGIESAVLFQIGDQTAEYGLTNPSDSWYHVQLGDDDETADLIGFGYRIVPAPKNLWESEGRLVPGLGSGELVFCRESAAGDELVGPWKSERIDGKTRLVPLREDGTIGELLIEDIHPLSILRVNGEEYLLPQQDDRFARWVDPVFSSSLASWFVKQLKESGLGLSSEVGSLPVAELARKIEQLGDPRERMLHESRLRRIEPILSSICLEEDCFLRLLDSNESLQSLVRRNVASRIEELENATVKRAEKEAYEQAEADLKELLSIETERLANVQAQLEQRREELRLLESRMEVVSESVQQSNEAESVLERTSEEGSLSAFDFAEQRLPAALSIWVGEVPRLESDYFLCAVCSFSWLLVPDAFWPRALADAIGKSSDFHALPAQPAWLSAKEVWNGGLSAIWETALADPNTLQIVVFQDINRSMTDLWTLEFVNLLTGLKEHLFDEARLIWPQNLRIFATVVKGEDTFPLSRGLLECVGAIQLREFEFKEPENFGQRMASHQDTSWRSWLHPPIPIRGPGRTIDCYGAIFQSAQAIRLDRKQFSQFESQCRTDWLAAYE